jgi:hypothetical protein
MEGVEGSKHKLGLHSRWSEIESLPSFYTSETQLRPEVTDSIQYGFDKVQDMIFSGQI